MKLLRPHYKLIFSEIDFEFLTMINKITNIKFLRELNVAKVINCYENPSFTLLLLFKIDLECLKLDRTSRMKFLKSKFTNITQVKHF